jgi:hypothetical protein
MRPKIPHAPSDPVCHDTPLIIFIKQIVKHLSLSNQNNEAKNYSLSVSV